MPVQPSTWYPGPLSPQQLNVDLYSWNGTGFGANGILWHAHKPVLFETLNQSKSLTVSATGTWGQLAGSGTTAFNVLDTGVLFGQGGDGPGGYALFQMTANSIAGSGIGYQPGNVSPTGTTAPAYPAGAGGYYLAAFFITGQTATATPAALGTGLYYNTGLNEIFAAQGVMQPHTTTSQGCSYYLDLINAGGGCFGTLASPLPQQQVATMLLPQGNGWVANWAVEIVGTASSSDINNFALVLGTSTITTSVNAGAVGVYAQSPVTVNSSPGLPQFLSVTAAGATPTSATTYGAAIYGPGMPSVGNAYVWQPAGFFADGSATSTSAPFNPGDTAGLTPRATWVWTGVSEQGQLIAANPNAYAANQNLAGWNAANATLTAEVPPGNPAAQPAGILLTPTGTASTATALGAFFTALPNEGYQAYADFFPMGGYTVQTGINWYDVNGNSLGSGAGVPTSLPTSTWTPVSAWLTSPPGAVSGQPWAQLVNPNGATLSTTVVTHLAGVLAVGVTPSPQVTWSGALTSALMNGPSGPQQSLALLNNPPLLRCASGLTSSIPNATATPVTFVQGNIITTPSLTVTTTSLPSGTVGTAYSVTLTATGGTGTGYTWSISSGSLPSWATLAASTGVISGTPTAAATTSFTVKVTDSASSTATKALSITVNAASSSLTVTTTSLPGATGGIAYSTTLAATGGTAPYTWSVSIGALPAWAALNATSGVISGTPTTAQNGTTSFTVKVTDSVSNTASQALSITVSSLVITTTSIPAATVSSAYSTTLAATGGTPAYTWSVSTGSLPAWASLAASTGVISGTPSATQTGTTNFTAKVTDSVANMATQALALMVNPATASGTQPHGPSGTWNLIEDAEFTGASLPSGWVALNASSINNVSTTSANVSVSGGYCNLVLNGGQGACIDSNPGADGYGANSGGFTLNVGYCVEAYINFPGPSGDRAYNWPAFWASGSSWPANGEEDIWESYNGTPSALNYHSPSGANNGPFPSGSWCNSFHIYTCVRGSSTIDVWWDGVLMRSVGRSDSGGAQGVKVNVGSGNTGATGAASTIKVQWVRGWSPG